ncbi:sodium/potassium/calcium exchanger 4-like [Dermatophagoides pteronyssinus]|uniref:sodium/potassium/calcium exchanger 4-like n=1 Tax=Dermatophagoides pteronyssinus TaxID=6956 RepID=UPI003F67F8F0
MESIIKIDILDDKISDYDRQHRQIKHRIHRKCILVIVIFIVACCNIYLRSSSKPSPLSSTKIRASLLNDNDDDGGSKSRFINEKSNFYFSRHILQAKTIKQSNNQSKTTINDDHPHHSLHNKTHKIGPKNPLIPLIDAKNKTCINPAYMEFPPDLFNDRQRSRGAILIHIIVVCYMFYCLAVVCDHYFLPSLEQCSQRLNLSEDVAGATFMAAGSSAPELFTAILGVFIAKGDVGTGTIVGSAVFNILFVIGFCSLFTVSTELNWWPVVRDSSYYTFTVLLLILCIYDGEVTTFESFTLLLFYGIYILIMKYNIQIRELVFQQWQSRFGNIIDLDKTPIPSTGINELNNLKGNTIHQVHYKSFQENDDYGQQTTSVPRNPFVVRQPETTIFEAANQIIIKYKRLFRPNTRFRSAAHLIMIRSKKAKQKQQQQILDDDELQQQQRRMSRIGPDDENFWRKIPDPNEVGISECLKWAAQAPLAAVLYYTIPDCRTKRNMFLATFLISIIWTAIFSYIMVWMVTMIGWTFGIPDSIMGITFLAAGTSVPDAYASMHAAKMGHADMAVSNSIGSNVFDILVGLALPWFIETTIIEPGTVSSINSGGLVYAVILLFLSLLATIYLFHYNHWTLNPSLGYSLLGTYVAFLIISSAIEFNLFGSVNPPICGETLS